MAWMLKLGDAAAQSFTSLGCAGLKREARSQAAGTFTFRRKLQEMDADPLAAVDTLAQVQWVDHTGTTVFFSGRITRVPLTGSAAAEDQEYEIADGWSDFERITYQQQWNRIVSVNEEGEPTIAAQYSACCLLGQALNGAAMSSGEVITDAVNWAIARGANCQLGTILMNGDAPVDSPVPIDEVTDLPVAEVIKKMLRFTPDSVAWFDYTATPPRFNITRQAQCAAVTMPFADVGDAVNITPRNDLLRSQVLLRYEQPNVNDGETFTEVYIDAAPDGADGLAFGALVATVRLAGSNATYQKQPVTTTPIPTGPEDANAIPFLKLNTAWLNKFSSDRLQVNDFTAEVLSGQVDDEGDPINDLDQGDYPNQLLTGTICKWMQNAYPDLTAAKATIYSNLSYIYPETPDEESTLAMKYFGPAGGNLPGWNNAVEVDFNIKATNAVQQTYAMLSDYTAAEAPPTGMAAVLYSALSVLQYQGTWNAIGDEVAPATRLGIALNLSGGRAEWAAMNALVQQITDDLDNGITTYKFGPAGHLTIQDLMEQLRATRQRTLSSKLKERQTGQPDSDVVNGAGHTHHSSGGSPPTPTAYPFIDFIDETDDGDGNPETWDALIGYGQSSFAGADEIDHAGPLESLEVSVGKDGSDWTAADGSHIDAQDALANALSIISGDDAPRMDRVQIGRTVGDAGGSIRLKPFQPSIYLSTHLDPDDDASGDPFIHLDLENTIMALQDENSSYINLTLAESTTEILINNGLNGNYSSFGDFYINLYEAETSNFVSIDASADVQFVTQAEDGSATQIANDAITMNGPPGMVGEVSITLNNLPGLAQFQAVSYLAPPLTPDGPPIHMSIVALCTTPVAG